MKVNPLSRLCHNDTYRPSRRRFQILESLRQLSAEELFRTGSKLMGLF
ncbi:hypothetical protein HMPREF1870_01918 [Bacteroidales bacterium KA00344]|nr:hypothetical protein HMPREF1870_01918 [Bacteroidales bacterium KA00344]